MSTKSFTHLLIYTILLSYITILSTANAAPLVAQTLPPTGQLAMSKSGPASVGSQGNITYRLTVSNTGNLTVTGVVITDTVPANSTLLSTTQNGTELNGVVTWNNLPDLAVGQAITVEMTVQAPFWQVQRDSGNKSQRERAPIEPRIVGGVEAEPGAWPWQAAIIDANNPSAYNGQKCGGTLIAPEWVMTAAHCVENVAFGTRDVLLGQHLLSGSDGQRINGVWWFIHPNFDSNLLDSDIALIRLARPAELNERVQLIDLVTPADFSWDAAGVMSTVTGWGNVNSSGGASFPDGLRQVEVPIVTNQACEAGYDQTEFPSDWITDNMMCAGYFEGGKDACNGDSGGPLMVPVPPLTGGRQGGTGEWKQAGIVSWGQGCAVVGEPGVYTRVSKFAVWVEQLIAADTPPINTVFNHRYGAQADGGLAVQGTAMVVTKITAGGTQPKLTISKVAPTMVQAGGVITYQLNITNSGSAAATNLVITDAMPSGVTFLQADNGGILQNGVVQWLVSRLDLNTTKTVQFAVQTSAVVTRQTLALRPPRQPRIFGGEVAQAGAWPWQAYLQVGAYQCGGVLIDKGWILTAAHCVYDGNNNVISPLDIQVILGAQNINQAENSQQNLTITAVIPHELYLTNGQDDVALLQLATPATLNERVQPIALFTGGSQADPGVMATVTGWGMTELGQVSSLLKQVTVPIVSNQFCSQVYVNDNVITAGMICAGGEAGQDSCNGDSGGPLVVPDGSGGYLLAGLVSFGGLSGGNLCGDAGVPGVYTRVSYYVNWIKDNMGEVDPVPTDVIVNAYYGVRADGGWVAKGTQRVTTTISSGVILPAAGGTITLDNYTTFTSDAQTFNGQLVELKFTGSLTNSPSLPHSLKGISLAYDLAAVDMATQATVTPTGRYTITLSYNHLLPLANGLSESRLGLYYYNNGAWLFEPTSRVNQTSRTVSASPNHLSVWAVLADVSISRVYLPQIVKNYCPSAFRYNETVLYNMKAINADQVWAAENCFQPGEGIIVAVLDTGVDLTHPDLVANLVTGRNFVEGSNFSPNDDGGHGTNVAGIIAAVANNRNAIGVAPKAKIMPVRVLGQDGGTFAGVAQGIAWATDNGANIINMSLGGTTSSNVMRDAADYAHDKGVLLVAAAGNCGDSNFIANGCEFRDQINYPAAYDSVIAVASTNEFNEQSTFSNQNSYVEIAAPGSNIYNTYLNGSYRALSGTSQATPHVAGVAALIWSRQPNLTNEQLRGLIHDTATDLGASGWDIQYGYGLINVAKALNLSESARRISARENPAEPAPMEVINAPFVAGQLLVKLKPGANLNEILQKQQLQPQRVAETISQISVEVLNVPAGQERVYLERLRQSSQVEYAELNYELRITN